MARDSAEEKWENSFEEAEEEGEEALSLCDLPINLSKEENESSNKEEAQANNDEPNQEDFDFGPWGSSVSTKSEMCAADDIFFQGQILPLRLSVSSESGVNKLVKQDSSLNHSRCVSRSESMDHNSVGGFTSFSSRSSSSSRSSHYSSNTSTSSSVATTISKPRIQSNFFHTHPSPKPQIRISGTSMGANAGSKRNRNSSVWDFLRLRLVRTPEIELQDLKIRNSVSRNSSSSSSSNSIKIVTKSNSSGSSNSKIDSCPGGKNRGKEGKQSLLEKGGGLLSGCSCSVNSVKPVPLNIIVIKSGNSSTENGNNNKSENRGGSIEEKLQELKKKRMVQKQQQQLKGKQAMSRHRTFEWIKELSHASYLDQEEEA